MDKIGRVSAGVILVTTALGGALVGYAVAGQPHMMRALQALRSAEGELQAATANKAGHRDRALQLVRDAIGEVDAGIAAGS